MVPPAGGGRRAAKGNDVGCLGPGSFGFYRMVMCLGRLFQTIIWNLYFQRDGQTRDRTRGSWLECQGLGTGVGLCLEECVRFTTLGLPRCGYLGLNVSTMPHEGCCIGTELLASTWEFSIIAGPSPKLQKTTGSP